MLAVDTRQASARIRPSIGAHQRYVGDGTEIVCFELGFGKPFDPDEILLPLGPANRNHQSTAYLELLFERIGTAGAPAATAMASKGASAGQPSVPSAQITSTFLQPARFRFSLERLTSS